MKKQTLIDLSSAVFGCLVLIGAGGCFSVFMKGCEAYSKEEKALAMIDSIQNELYKRDSIIIAACDTLDYIFTKDRAKLYEDDFDMEGETPQDVGERAANVLFNIGDKLREEEFYREFEELKETINEEEDD